VKVQLYFCLTKVEGHSKNGKDKVLYPSELGFPPYPEEWKIFIDASKLSLKAVLLHNGNEEPSITNFPFSG
jgi:hypothetical protein